LPRIVAECVEGWSLLLGEPYDAHVSYVARAELDDGAPAVLKVNFPEVETEHEADALAFWSDDASVRLLASSRERNALLLERCEPGTQLWERSDGEALEIACELFPKLWRSGDPGPPFRRIVDEAPTWAKQLAARALERELLDAALDALSELPRTQGDLVLCNEDFHGGNVLLSERGWLAIDPKPIVAEREFGVVSLVRDRRPVDAPALARRLDALAELGLDRERMRRWSLVHALWWGADDTTGEWDPEMVEAARLLL
jgi:streptomycin 6-kinase